MRVVKFFKIWFDSIIIFFVRGKQKTRRKRTATTVKVKIKKKMKIAIWFSRNISVMKKIERKIKTTTSIFFFRKI